VSGRPVTDDASTVAPADATSGPSDEELVERAVRVGVSLAAVFGFVLTFGAGAGAVLGLQMQALHAAGVPNFDPVAEEAVLFVVYAVHAVVLPVGAFLFLAMYDDADVQRPAWPERHPPASDAWLLVLGAAGLATVALPTPAWPDVLRLAGGVAAGLTCFLALPLWLGRRCLRHPGYLLGALAVLVTPLVAVVGLFAVAMLGAEEPLPGTRLLAVASVAAAGVAVPFKFAHWSPGPRPLARRIIRALGPLVTRLRRA